MQQEKTILGEMKIVRLISQSMLVFRPGRLHRLPSENINKIIFSYMS